MWKAIILGSGVWTEMSESSITLPKTKKITGGSVLSPSLFRSTFFLVYCLIYFPIRPSVQMSMSLSSVLFPLYLLFFLSFFASSFPGTEEWSTKWLGGMDVVWSNCQSSQKVLDWISAKDTLDFSSGCSKFFKSCHLWNFSRVLQSFSSSTIFSQQPEKCYCWRIFKNKNKLYSNA